MQPEPMRVVMSREGFDANHEVMRDVHGVILESPHVGELLQIFFDNGKYLVTSKVQRIEHIGDELIVETANSTYRLHSDTN